MSTRYVWAKHNTTETIQYTWNRFTLTETTVYRWNRYQLNVRERSSSVEECRDNFGKECYFPQFWGNSYTIVGDHYEVTGDTQSLPYGGRAEPSVDKYQYCFGKIVSADKEMSKQINVRWAPGSGSTQWYGHIDTDGWDQGWVMSCNYKSEYSIRMTQYILEASAGTSAGTVESTDPDAYPKDGAKDGYYYKANGSYIKYGKGTANGSVTIDNNASAYPNNGQQGNSWYEFVGSTIVYSKGDKISDISSDADNAYPNDARHTDGFWYVYQGTDSIDPTTVETVVNKWLYIGQQLTITASPSTSIKYGGTISYQYQVQLNGGAWTNIGSKTTATSINYTIPEGTTSIRFQVLASDNMGFTSTTLVQSPTYKVSKYVPGIAQKLHRKNASGEYDLVHMETDTQIVLMNSGSTLEDELLAILAEIERRGG